MAGLLIEYGANVNSITDGMTVLSYVISVDKPDKEMIRLLSLAGGKINFSITYFFKELNNFVTLPDLYFSIYLKEDFDAVLFLWQVLQILKK